MAPRPKPTAAKILAGNPGKRPLNDREPTIPKAPLRCPQWLSKPAKTEWRRIVPLLQKARQVTAVDRAVLAAYCSAWSTYLDADKQLQRHGPIAISDRTGTPYPSPYLTAWSMAMKDMVRFAAELGITPSSRSRVKTNDDAAASDPLVKLFEQQQAKEIS